MKQQEEISVILATYNGSKFVSEQINSILKQTLLPDEIIFVDDASSDDTTMIIENLMRTSNIDYKIVVHERNQGVIKTFEDGIKLAKYDYILFCDQDDVWSECKIEKTIGTLKTNKNINLVICNAAITDEKLNPIGKTMFEYIKLPVPFYDGICILNSLDAARLLLKRNYATGMCMGVRKEIAFQALPLSDNMVFDSYIAWNAAVDGSIVFLDEQLVYYRQHDKNVVGAKDGKKAIRVYIRDYLNNRYSIINGYYKKYNDLNLRASNEILYEIKEAVGFYKWRTEIIQYGRIKGIANVIKNITRGNYKKYSAEPLYEVIKDMLALLFQQRVSEKALR